ncbi:hypothetical protein Tco_0461712 [Tanacetum coccineum]
MPIELGDEALMIQRNRIDGYASIVASKQRAKMFGRIDMLERDNMRLKGMLGVERQRVERTIMRQKEKLITYDFRQLKAYEKNYPTHDLELGEIVDCECNIRYHPRKAIAAADALSRKERAKPLRDENLHGMDRESETHIDRTLRIRIRSWLPHFGDLRKLIMHGSHKSDYFIHPGSADETLAIPLDEIQIDEKLHFIEEPVEIMDREVKCLKQSRILIVKVRWNSRRGPEFTWEREDQM